MLTQENSPEAKALWICVFVLPFAPMQAMTKAMVTENGDKITGSSELINCLNKFNAKSACPTATGEDMSPVIAQYINSPDQGLNYGRFSHRSMHTFVKKIPS